MYYGCPWRMHWLVIKHSLTIEVNLMRGRLIKIKRTLCIKTLKNSFEMAQLSNEQRVFVVETYFRRTSYKKVKGASTTPPESLQILRQRVCDEFDNLRQNPGMIRRSVRAMQRRVYLCTEKEGRRVERRA